ncbi:MAG: OadG family protein [Candidatus Methylumidiphilus sp.]
MESSIGELILSGVKLMFIGMGIVFLFLALLVWVIGVSSKLIQRFSPDAPAHSPHPASPSAGDGDSEAEIVAAISAALHLHQNQ